MRRQVFIGLAIIGLLVLIALLPSASHGATNTGTLTLTLPTKEILVPNQLIIPSDSSNYTFTFNSASGQFSPTTQGPYTVAVTTNDGGRAQGYTITIQGFAEDGGQCSVADAGSLSKRLLAGLDNTLAAHASSPPFPGFLPAYFSNSGGGSTGCATGGLNGQPFYQYRLTFVNSLSQSEIASYANYLASTGNTDANSFIGNASCSVDNSGTYLCLRENAEFSTPNVSLTGPLYMIQSVPLGNVGALTVQGNVAASGTISGFNFTSLTNAFAIGGTIPVSIPNASQQLSNYINQNSTKFSWQNVQPQLMALFNKRTTGTTYSDGASYTGSVWNLNSTTTDPTNASANSFSTPPEGKLWNVAGSLTFPGNVTFSGSGTIVTTGNVIFDGNVSCTPGTRLGIIADGSISFSNSGGSTISCGAYTALDGNIQFLFSVTSGSPSANGIFIAQNSIVLPSVSGRGNYSITYDSQFASDPTVLFQQLLQVVFSTSS